ncbi:3-oxo-tetronate kinase [Halomonas dongshanensis]|uniref:3-oxo-tetronate kinase n=1 Tax=Halomonas dongshanensis TaxID=2890835 RepID=A0ABT2EFM1_9GAMM|nr:3-oxo-tetronate kinase [Halomonas dongshanensis]MCS2610393.1 four-carbon acid sugar kinase family protein [Halomonas dongshanensis]
MAITLGAIADDFTGATDLANNLVRGGMRCLQVIGVPKEDINLNEIDAVVIALKTRSCTVNEAIADSLQAAAWLRAQGAKQLFFKYCSTFDSTDKGNIGPVADALLDELKASQTVMVPAFPINGRTVYQGHLFVGDRLLNDSGMQHHPLTPMKDADLVRVLSHQTPHKVGLTNHTVLALGAEATRAHLASLEEQSVRHVVCDTLDEHNLDILAEATVQFPLVTGGSGLGQALPAQYRNQGWLDSINEPGRLQPASGSALILSGSCSRATLAQVANFLERYPDSGFALDPLSLAKDDKQWKQALAFALENVSRNAPTLIYASAEPANVGIAQKILGRERAGALVEEALSQLAIVLVDKGVGRLVVAGGETSGAVTSALGITALHIGEQIDPGVPWTQTALENSKAYLSLALKSGNFGEVNFFTKAFEVLP